MNSSDTLMGMWLLIHARSVTLVEETPEKTFHSAGVTKWEVTLTDGV